MKLAYTVPVVVAIAFALFRRVAPYNSPEHTSAGSLNELRTKYAKWEAAGFVPFVLFAVVLGYAWHQLFQWLASTLNRAPQEAVFSVAPDAAYWALPSIFLGIITSAVPSTAMYKLLLRDRYGEYDHYCSTRVGFNTNRVGAVLAILVIAGAGAFLLFGVRSRVDFLGDSISIRRFGHEQTVYPYSSIRSIYSATHVRAPNGKIVHRPHHIILFVGGGRWSTRDGLRDPRLRTDSVLVRYVATRSDRPVEQVRLAPDRFQ